MRSKSQLILLFMIPMVMLSASPESEVERLNRENREMRAKIIQMEQQLAESRIWLAATAVWQENSSRLWQAYLDIDRKAAQEYGVPIPRIFETLAKEVNLLEKPSMIPELQIRSNHGIMVDLRKIAKLRKEPLLPSSPEMYRLMRLLHIMDELSRRGNALSMAALEVRDECRNLLGELPVGAVRKAQVELRLDELSKRAGEFARITIPGDSSVGSCRVLGVDRDLDVIVISVGSGAGVFPGMIFHAIEKPQLKFRVIGTRFEGAVAERIAGEKYDIVPGMELSALQRVTEDRKSILEL